MNLCRYFDKYKYGKDVLKKLRLKVSDPTTYNDPFEFLPAIQGELDKKSFINYISQNQNLKQRIGFDKIYNLENIDIVYNQLKNQYPEALRKYIYRIREIVSNQYRVLCFSDLDKINPQEDILMWSHYTQNHSGLRIVFDSDKINISRRQLIKIDYKTERSKIHLNDILNGNKNLDNKFKTLIKEKCKTWDYENEYRLLIERKECYSKTINNLDLDFIKIKPNTINRVDIGVNVKDNFKNEILELVDSEVFSHVEVNYTNINDTEYKLNYERIQ